MNMQLVVLVCSALAHASQAFPETLSDEPEKALCLLNVAQKRYQRSFGDTSTLHGEVSNIEFKTFEGISLNVSQHTEWLLQFTGFERTMNSSLDDLARMADDQDTRGQKCRQRLRNTKDQLKHIVADTSEFSAKVKNHEKKLVEYKQKLNGSETNITQIELKYHEALDSCKEERSQAKRDQLRYAEAQGELKRLIAGVSDGEGMAVLLQLAAAMAVHQTADGWNSEICLSFLAFLKKRSDLHLNVSVPPNDDCSRRLESTRKLFTETMTSVSKLEKKASMRTEERQCEHNARLVQSTSLSPIVAERTTTSNHIIESTNSLALMRPVFNRLQAHVNDFDEHVKMDIAPECDRAGKVGKSLRALKDLLASLAKCPGKDGRAVLLAV